MNETPAQIITEAEFNLLREFQIAASYLFEHSLIRDNVLLVKTSIRWDVTEGHSETRHKIDIEKFESLLVRLRIFCLKDEDLFFDKVANLISKLLNGFPIPNWSAKELREMKKHFEGNTQESKFLSVTNDGVTHHGKDVFEHVLYGDLFHKNSVKRTKLREIKSLFGEFIDDMMIMSVIHRIDQLNYLQWLVGTMLVKIEKNQTQG